MLFDDFLKIISTTPQGYSHKMGCFALETYIRSPKWIESRFRIRFPHNPTMDIIPAGNYFWNDQTCQLLENWENAVTKLQTHSRSMM